MNPQLVPRFFRTIAILIAILGAIDPAVTSTRRTRPEVAVVAGSAPGDEAVARRVANTLDGKFTAIAAPFTAAGGTVLVGNELPTLAAELPPPVFAVISERNGPTVTLEGVSAPLHAPLDARIGISVSTRVSGARGRRLEVSLRSGELVVDRVSLDIEGDDERRVTELAFVPTAVGAVPLRVTAEVAGTGGAGTAAVDLMTDVREQRWAVLFFDPRPSWQSTFVRRAIERDPRFVVTSRVVTSRSLSTDAGRPPATLDDFSALLLFDAVVVGAPDALADRDVSGLDAYLRRRGGTVVLLLDQRGGGPYHRLTGVREWMGSSSAAGISVLPGGSDSAALRASEIAWPRALPAGARELARSRLIGGDSGVSHPVLWRSAVGAGQLIVSGALDAWRYRDPALSAFDSFWRATIGSAADAALPPVTISLGTSILAPNERTEISATVRDASLGTVASNRAVRASVTALLETPAGAVPIRLWPSGPVGTFRGTFRAPTTPGTYRVVVIGDGSRADAPIIVAGSISRPIADDADLVAAWAGSHGGSSFSSTRLEQLAPAVLRVVQPALRRETSYPMRSPWWIIPFSLALGMEWLWRRKRGLA